jgi:hypothetical protein
MQQSKRLVTYYTIFRLCIPTTQQKNGAKILIKLRPGFVRHRHVASQPPLSL